MHVACGFHSILRLCVRGSLTKAPAVLTPRSPVQKETLNVPKVVVTSAKILFYAHVALAKNSGGLAALNGIDRALRETLAMRTIANRFQTSITVRYGICT